MIGQCTAYDLPTNQLITNQRSLLFSPIDVLRWPFQWVGELESRISLGSHISDATACCCLLGKRVVVYWEIAINNA